MHPFFEKLQKTGNYMAMQPYEPLDQGPKLTAGVLMSTPDCVSPPHVLQSTNAHIDATNNCEIYAEFKLGAQTSGHGGIVHGGLLATLLDESLCRCGFAILPHHVGVTASLDLKYKAPTPTNSTILLVGKTEKLEGRKVWVKGWTYILPEDFAGSLDELSPTMEATLLAIEPKWYEKLLNGPAVRAERVRAGEDEGTNNQASNATR